MAFTINNVGSSIWGTEIELLDLKVPAELNLTGASGRLFGITVDAINNPGAAAYARIVNAATFAVGTDAAHMLFFAPRGKRITYWFPKGLPYSTAISIAAVESPGGTTGSTAPSGTANVYLALT